VEAAGLRLTSTLGVPGFSFLIWDTEGNVQTRLNLLRDGAGAVFQVETDGKWVDGEPVLAGDSQTWVFTPPAADSVRRNGVRVLAETT
jgi:hypothetical protein